MLLMLNLTATLFAAPDSNKVLEQTPAESQLKEEPLEKNTLPKNKFKPKEALNSVVVLESGPNICAGVLIGPKGHVATAYHCIAGGGKTQLELKNGIKAKGRIVSVDVQRDLAIILSSDLAGASFLNLREEAPEIGEAVFAIGHPKASLSDSYPFVGLFQWTVSRGVLSAKNNIWLQSDVAVNPGSSGGPLIDNDGRVVGIASRKLNGEGLALFGRAKHLESLLEKPRPLAFLTGSLHAQLGYEQPFSGDGALAARLTAVLRKQFYIDGIINHALPSNRLQLTGQSFHSLGRIGLGISHEMGFGVNCVQIDGGLSLAWFENRVLSDDFESTDIAIGLGASAGIEYRGLRIQWTRFLEDDQGDMISFGVSWPGILTVF